MNEDLEKPDSPPTSRLLTYGEAKLKDWPDYLTLGFTEEHVPELLRMMSDEDLIWADSESLEVWAPVHAWRVLGQLRAEAAIDPLISLFDEDDESYWIGEEVPIVLGRIGPGALPALTRALARTGGTDWPAINIARSIEEVGQQHPGARNECVSILTRQLRRFERNDPTLNGFLISSLVDLKAVEALPVMREAYERDCVDTTILGDIEDVQILLGLLKERVTPPNYVTLRDLLLDRIEEEQRSRTPLETAPAVTLKVKVGRNDPCPCGSGKKFKKCCLNKPA